MKYTKPWTLAQAASSDDWNIWCMVNAVIPELEYRIVYTDSQVIIEFIDQDRAAEFAQHFGL
jgi:hypothetical protein